MNLWQYEDRTDSARPAIDVLWTKLDVRLQGKFRVRIYGREFIRNTTDVVRVFFDTRRANSGPEYRVTWFIGRNPAAPAGRFYLETTDTWEVAGKLRGCRQMQKSVNYATDVITIIIPKACVSSPSQVRWAGYTGQVTSASSTSMRGYWDDFPDVRLFPNVWAG